MDAGAEMKGSLQSQGSAGHVSEMKILIIDDDPSAVALLESLFSGSGYTRVKSIMDPRQSVETCRTFEPDIVLLDLMMPYLDGFSVLELLRSDHRQTLLPVVILTADVNGESKYRALRAGATDFLLKPLDLTEVLLRVRLLMERRRIEEELQRQKEKAEAASAAKDHFLAMTSHELRTPLTPILLWASAAVNEPDLRPEFRDGLKMVCRNVELEARMVDDMLDLTRITRGRLKLNLRSVDAHDVVRHAVGIMRSTIEERHLALNLALEAFHHRLHADETRLHQVFWNLLGNACKFTPENGTIFIRTSNHRPGKITIEIIDSGVGLERESLNKIFEAFERVDSKREGLGLGLAICKAIVELHGGTISAHSAGLGEGATFIVELPIEQSVNPGEVGTCRVEPALLIDSDGWAEN